MAITNAKKRKALASKKISKKNNTSKKNSAKQSPPTSKKNTKTSTKKVVAQKKKKQEEEEEEEIDIEEEDIEFYESNAAASFLMKMDTKAFSKPVHLKSNKLKAMEETEKRKKYLEEAESKPRKAAWEKKTDLSTKLPVKFMDGSVRPNKLMAEENNKQKEEVEEEEVQEEEEEEEEEDGVEYDSDVSEMEFEEVVVSDKKEQESPNWSPIELKHLREHRIAQKKIEIAHLSEKILENPEEAMKKNKEHEKNWSLMQQLHALCEDQDLVICQLSMVSELTVLLDILPDYRIRIEDTKTNQNNNNKKQQQHKKKVQQLMDYEASLLHYYQNFLKFCNKLMTNASKFYLTMNRQENQQQILVQQQSNIILAETAIKCLCECLQSKFEFNFALNLILSLIPWGANCVVDKIRWRVCETIQTVFLTDKSYATSLLIIQQITVFLKKKNQKMKFSSLLETFTSLNLDQTMEEGEKARQKIKLDRKKRRQAQDSIAKGLKEAEAIIDPNEKAKNQADILHEMVLIYFRFLKQQTVIVEKNEKNGGCFLLLPCILKGLSKFGCLIHLDIMIDLLKVLKVLLVQQKEFLPLNCSFEAVLTCLKTLQGPAAQELLIDEKEFIDILYHLFKCFIMFQEKKQIQNSFPIALECIEIIFLRRKEIILERVAAFIQRLLLICMHLHAPNQILSIMALVRKLMHRYTKVQQLLESDLDRVTSGEYRGEVDDPDFANPFANACWAFALLNHHYHPFVASFSLGTASLDPSLPNEAPLKLLENYHTFEVKGEFIPKITIPKPNSLHQKLLKNQKHQKYSKPIFIIPPKRSPSVFLTTCMATLQNQGMEEQQIDFASYHMKK